MRQALYETRVRPHVTVFIQQSDAPGKAQVPEASSESGYRWGPLTVAPSEPAPWPFLLLVLLKPKGFKCLCRN